jgi:hypothetical protein
MKIVVTILISAVLIFGCAEEDSVRPLFTYDGSNPHAGDPAARKVPPARVIKTRDEGIDWFGWMKKKDTPSSPRQAQYNPKPAPAPSLDSAHGSLPGMPAATSGDPVGPKKSPDTALPADTSKK